MAVALVVLAGLLAINATVAYHNVSRLRENSDWVAHTQEVTAALEQLMSTLKDAETGQRGYVITGRDEYLLPYNRALVEYGQAFERVKALTADNPQQQASLTGLTRQITEKLNELQRVIEVRRDQGFEAAQQTINEDSGKRVMDAIRTSLSTMQAREKSLLAERRIANNQTYTTAVATILLALLCTLLLVVAFGWLLQRYLQAMADSAAKIFEQHELLQATLISIGDGVIATDMRGRVTMLNDVAQHLTGWQQDEAAGMALEQVFQIINEESRKAVSNPALRALAEGKTVGLANHTILLSKEGAEWPIDDSAAPIKNQQGDVRGAVLVFREIRERKRQERELERHARALAEADHRKDEFLATLAHELRNPLAPISNALQLWPFVENDKQELENLRAMMERQLQLMVRLIDDLLDISRITRGKVELRKQRVDLRTVVAGTIDSMKPMLEAGSHHLSLTLPEQALTIDGDVARLNQVFGNILNNAAKYSGRNGVIWVNASAEDSQAVVRIRDNGPGIPSQMLSSIFDMFRQVDHSLSRANGGLGIGLTLVKRLIEEHGGHVEANSAGPGLGSEFVVRLPLSQPETQRPAAEQRYQLQQVAAAPRLRVAIVDDVKASAQTVALMLKAIGQEVTVFNDGPAAIEWALANSPDAMFLDIAMPGMDGYQVARRLREELPSVLLVALTGYGQEDDRRRAFEAGFNHHLVKPTSLEALERVLAGKR